MKPRTAPRLDDASRKRLLEAKPTATYRGTPHDHQEFIPGCLRCDLSRAEAQADADIANGDTVTFTDPDEALRWLQEKETP